MKRTNLIIGKINSGKTRGILLNKVNESIKSNKNLLILDNKEEYYGTFAGELKEKGYNVLVLNLKDSIKSNGFNPLLLPYQYYKEGNKDKAIELINQLCLEICKEDRNNADPFWENTAANYLCGLCLALFKDAKEEEINLGSIQVMLTQGENNFENTTVIKKYFENYNVLDSAYIAVSPTIFAPVETKGSILSVLKQKLNLYCMRENLLNLLCSNEINFKNINNKTAIFIIGNEGLNRLTNIFINQLYSYITKNKLSFHFILDNFDSLTKLLCFKSLIEDATYYNLNVDVAIRDINKFEECYDKYLVNLFENVLTLNEELNSYKDIGDYNEYPIINEKKNAYFDIVSFVNNK